MKVNTVQHEKEKRISVIIYLSLFIAVMLLFITSPRQGDFWWSDASRHAMDGAFYYSFFADFPMENPKAYAISFYLQYPAITIVFYPPLFAMAASLFFYILGPSHFAVQVTVAAFFLGLTLGIFRLSRRWMSPVYAFCACLFFIGAHEIAFWGRQVMLEIPAYALLIWGVHSFFEFLETRRYGFLYGAVFLYGSSLYTKLNVIFMAPVFILIMYRRFGSGIFKERRVIFALLTVICLVLPLFFMTMKFGQTNIGAAMGDQAAGEFSRLSYENWTYYLYRIPHQIGRIQTAGIVLLLALSVIMRSELTFPPFLRGFFGIWFLWGYLFFSFISLKEPRHSVFILFPLIFLAIWAFGQLFPGRLASAGLAVCAVATFAYTMLNDPVPYIRNYHKAADFVADHTPSGHRVMIHSYWDGNFIFNLWCRKDRRDLSVLRSDKLLLRMAVKRSMGVEEKQYTDAELGTMLNEYGVYYVVSEPGFWDDLKPMRQLEKLLQTPQFEAVRRIPLEDNFSDKKRELVIYRNLQASMPSRPLKIELPIVGMEIREESE